MIALVFFSFIFFHNSFGQKCSTDLYIDSMFTFRHYDNDKLMAAKIITYGGNSSISCLITNRTKDELKLRLKKNFEWVFTPLFKIGIEPKKVKITQKINFTEIFTQTNGTIYVTGSCNELQLYRFSPDAVGIYSCVPKEGLRYYEYYDKYFKVEIFVDGELIGPYTECPMDLKTIRNTYRSLPPNLLLHFKQKQDPGSHMNQKSGIYIERTNIFVPSLEEECSPCYDLKDPINTTGKLIEKNSCLTGYFVRREENVNEHQKAVKRYFTSFHSCEVMLSDVGYLKMASCLNASACVPELCSLPIEVEPIDLAFNFSVNLGYKKSSKFKIDPSHINVVSYIEEPEGYAIEMKCPMINVTFFKSRGRVHWYKCNVLCVKISKSKRNFTRYKINQSERTLSIQNLKFNDTGKFVCVRYKIILGALSLKVTPALGYLDVRSPMGSMVVSSLFVLFVYVVLLVLRISLKKMENSATKKKIKTKNKGDHKGNQKNKKYKKLPKYA